WRYILTWLLIISGKYCCTKPGNCASSASGRTCSRSSTYVQHGFQYQFWCKNWGGNAGRSVDNEARKSKAKCAFDGVSARMPVTYKSNWLSTRRIFPSGSSSPKYLRAIVSVSRTEFGFASAVRSSPRRSSKSNTSKRVESTKKKRDSL